MIELPPLPASVNAAKVPRWDFALLERRPCPACGEDRPGTYCRRPDGLVVSACPSCGMYYVADTPSEPEIAAFYQRYSAFKNIKKTGSASDYRLRIGSSLDFYTNVLVNTGGLKGKRLLEIGCAMGSFLQNFRFLGAEVTGVEIDRLACEFLRGQGFPVHEQVPSDQTFDVVCAFNLLEHLKDPGKLLETVARILTPDGRLMIAIPNGDLIDRFGPYWVGFRVDPEHFNYFNLKTLSLFYRFRGIMIEQYWENMQPHLVREGAPAEARSERRRLRDRLLARFLRYAYGHVQAVADQGSYQLTVLARKS